MHRLRHDLQAGVIAGRANSLFRARAADQEDPALQQAHRSSGRLGRAVTAGRGRVPGQIRRGQGAASGVQGDTGGFVRTKAGTATAPEKRQGLQDRSVTPLRFQRSQHFSYETLTFFRQLHSLRPAIHRITALFDKIETFFVMSVDVS